MSVANPWMHQSWSEYKKQREEGRRRRLSWMQRVMRWDKLDEDEGSQPETEDDEDDVVSEEEIQGKRSKQNGKTLVKQRQSQDLERLVQAKMDKIFGKSEKMEGDDHDEADSVSDVKNQDKRLGQNGKILEKQRESQYFEPIGKAKIGKMFGKWGRMEGDGDDEVDSVSDEEIQDKRPRQNGKIWEKQRESEDFVPIGQAKMGKIFGKWGKMEGDGDDEVDSVSDEEIQDKRSRRNRKTLGKQRESQDLERIGQAKIDKMLGKWGKVEDDDDESVSDEEIQDINFEQNRKIKEKQSASQHLEEHAEEKMEEMLEKLQNIDFETPMQVQNNVESVCQENQEASKSHVQDFEQENPSETPECLQRPQAEEQLDAKRNNLEELGIDLAMGGAEEVANQNMDSLCFEVHSEKNDKDLTENGQSEENGGKQFELHSEFHSSAQSSASGLSENGELHYEASFYQDTEENKDVEVEEPAATPKDESEFDFSGENSAPGISENGELYCQDSYYQDTEQNKDLDVNRFENLTKDCWAGTSTQGEVEEPASKPKDDSEFDFSVENSASGFSENGELHYEASFYQDTEENKDVEVEEPAATPKDESEFDFSGENSAPGISENGELYCQDSYYQDTEQNKDLDVNRFENLTKDCWAGTSTQGEVEEPASKPKDDSEFDFSVENSASGFSENGEFYYEEFYYQDTEEDNDLEDYRSENLTEDGWENGELDYEEFCNQNVEKGKDFEVNRVEDLTGNDEVKTSTKEKVDKPTEEHLTEEEATTTDEDDDILGDEDTDCYNLNEIKTYRQDNHISEIFQTLNEFKRANILTDLELKTSDGKSIRVHAIVFSAVSFLARRFLSTKHTCFWDRKVQLMELGPEVEYKALEAVVEFAYTGAIQCLNSLNAGEIKTAARYLSASRIMEICDRELAKNKGKTKEVFVPASTELKINLQKIEELWMNNMGCDVTLDVISASFQVHKVILAASSDYFRAMFTLGMKESSQSSVYLKFLSAPELEALLSCSYTGSISLSWNCIFEITSTALQLQYQPALDHCFNFLQREINPHSCLDVASFAEAFGIIKLLDHAEDYVLRQFQKVSRTAKFKDLPAKNLLKYLNSFALCVSSELVVFRAVVDWIQAKPKRRLKLAKELMKTIHFPLMTFKEFKEVQALNMWSNHSLKELYEAIFEDFCSNEIETQEKCRIYLPKESLVLSGGDQILEDLGTRSISKNLWFGNSLRNHMGIKKAMEWRQLGEMPQPARFSHEVAVINGQLYILGGKKYYGTGDTLKSFFRYSPLENTWEELPPMHQARCSFSLVVLESKLYAIGGQSHPDYVETVEQYCPTANSWSFTCPLDLPLGGHVARVLAGQIFISGGLNNDYDSLSSMFAYHPEKGSTYLQNMTRPRALHCMEVLGDFLYVAGGLSQTDSTEIVNMLACEMYDPEANSWTCFPALPVPHVGAGSAVLEGKFYVLGGYSQEDYSDTKMVHRYDPSTQQWENMGKMPGPNNDLRACVLGLPEHLRLCPD